MAAGQGLGWLAIARLGLVQAALGAIVVNNKISNVCAPGGVADSEALCVEAGRLLGINLLHLSSDAGHA